MNFTREPIIETVITPREGCRLVIRSSKGAGREEYAVEAIEVVSFGRSLFFRSLERPKAFLVPVSDYEVLELKEARMVLKNAPSERSIKIGGGREGQVRTSRTSSEEVAEASEQRTEKGKRRRRSRRGSRERQEPQSLPPSEEEASLLEVPVEVPALEPLLTHEEQKPSFISKLFPPPPTLIKESLGRYKPAETQEPFPEEEEPEEPPPPPEEGAPTFPEE